MPSNSPQHPPQPLGAEVQRWLNERFAPAAVVVDEQQRILQFANHAHRYLMIPEGEPTHELGAMLDEASGARIKAMIAHAVRSDQPQTARPVMLRRPGGRPGDTLAALVGVSPLPSDGSVGRRFVVTFQELSDEQSIRLRALSENEVIAQLGQELRASREDLERTGEELKAAAEESRSVNEELRSANERLAASAGELDALGARLRAEADEVERVNNDIANLLTSTDLGVLLLDSTLRIKRFTPGITDLFRMAPSDIDRPVGDIARRFEGEGPERDARRVLERPGSAQKNIVAENGRLYQQRILPYRTRENQIDGVVIVYSDVTETQRALTDLARANLQKSSLAQLSASMINLPDMRGFYELTVRLAMRALEADFTKILRLTATGDDLELVAGQGWDQAFSPGTLVGAARDSQAGYALITDSPVVVTNMEKDKRFTGSQLLADHGVLSGISCIIRGPRGRWGVLGVHSRRERHFSENDIDFVSSLASLIGEALELMQTRTRLENSSRRLEFALHAAEIIAWEFNPDLGVVVWPGDQLQRLGLGTEEPETSDAFWARVHPDDRQWLRGAMHDSFTTGKEYRADFRIVLPSGEVRWLHGAGAVMNEPEGGQLMYGVNFDITARKTLEGKLELYQRQLKAEVQQHQQLANDRLREIRRMSHQMVIAESVERRRLANELHDNLAQLLNLSLMRLSSLAMDVPEETAKRVSDIRQIMQQAINTTRSVMDQLTPQVLDELGLGPAIDWLAEQTKEMYNLDIDVRHRTEPIGISRESQLIVFRSVRELLINVARHAGIDRARVTLSRAGPMLCIEVHDEGKGFDPEKLVRQTQRRYGLLGMQERISHIGGTVDIESHPSGGSTVRIKIPDPTPSEERDEQD